jgi:hypothetical protein
MILVRKMGQRIYTQESGVLNRAIAIATDAFGLPANASKSRQLQAVAEYVVARTEQDEALAERIAAYETLAADDERSTRIRRNSRAAVEEGLL